MDLLTIIIIGLALATDCFAISICIAGINHIKTKNLIKIIFYFSFFQFAMLILGFYFGKLFQQIITGFDHWIAAILLTIIGIKIIIESLTKVECTNLLSHHKLLMFSLATSIDALVVGIALISIPTNIWISGLMVGIVTGIVTLVGLKIGKMFKHINVKYVGITGGLVLIGIGIKILIQHLYS